MSTTPVMPTFQAPPTTTPEPASQALQPAPNTVTDETFDDLAPTSDDEGSSHKSGNAVEADDDPGFMDFETLLTQPAPPAAAPSAPVPTTPAQVAPAVVAPVAAPAPASAPAAPAAAAPTATPPDPLAAQPQPTPATPQAAPEQVVPEQTLDQLRNEMEKNKGVIVKQIAAHYEQTFSDEDVELFQTEPKKALAQMAAQLHVDSLSNVMAVFSQNLPRMVMGLMEAQRVSKTETEAFYNENPALNQQAHGQVVNSIAATLRKMNPNMDAPTFKTTLAAMATQALRLQYVAPQAPAVAQPQAAPVRAPRGFQPAGNGQVPSGPQSRSQGNPWDAMVEAVQSDDR